MFMNLLYTYGLQVAIVLLVIIVLIILWKSGRQKIVLQIALAAVTKAEKLYGSKTGVLKFATAMTYMYKYLPKTVRFLFTQKEIEIFVEQAVKDLKEYLIRTGATLDNGQVLIE